MVSGLFLRTSANLLRLVLATEVRLDESKSKFTVFSDKVTLLKGFDAVLKKGSINPLTLEYIHKDKYSIDENYYLKLNNTNFIEIDLNKKSFLQLMGDKASSVEKYASDFKLSFKSETDLLKIFQYYDTL